MKYMLLGFFLLIMNPLFSADEAMTTVAPVRQVHVVCSEIDQSGNIEVRCGAVLYTHSFSLDVLQMMDKAQINDSVTKLLATVSTVDELSVPQKGMLARLASDTPKVEAIVDFLFNHSRRVVVHAAGEPFFPRYGRV
jgi:hypothetical protein